MSFSLGGGIIQIVLQQGKPGFPPVGKALS
jgi:hypothetical protein